MGACLLLGMFIARGQGIPTPSSRWDVHFGGTNGEIATAVLPRSDGGVLVGATSSSGAGGGKTTEGFGGVDYYVVNLDADGHRLWEGSYGGNADDFLTCLAPAANGGFLVGGYSSSHTNGNKSALNRGSASRDFWAVRVDATGHRLWDETYGGSGTDELRAARALPDGGFILGGISDSLPGGTLGNKTAPRLGSTDIYLVRIDSLGRIVWDRTYGGSGTDSLMAIESLHDGGYLVAGTSTSTNGQRTVAYGDQDFWLLRLDPDGNVVWQQSYGGSGRETLLGACLNRRPLRLYGNSTSPNDGSKTSFEPPAGTFWRWVVEVGDDGRQLRDFALPMDIVRSIDSTPDGGFVACRQSTETTAGLVRFDSRGELLWETHYPSTSPSAVSRLVMALDDGSFLWGGDGFYTGASTDLRIIRTTPERYSVDATPSFPERGSVTLNPTAGGDGRFEGGTRIVLTATPEAGFEFSYWSGSTGSVVNPMTLFVDGDKSVTANFSRQSGSPQIAIDPMAISMNVGDFVNARELRIWNSGAGTLRYSLVANQTWIRIEPSTGVSVGETNGHRIIIDPAAFDGGIHQGVISVRVSSTPASTMPIPLTVRRAVSLGAPVQWQRVLNVPGTWGSGFNAVVPTPDGGVLVGGAAADTGGSKTSPAHGGGDFWIVRMDAEGNSIWDRSFGGDQEDILYAMAPTPDGGWILGGTTKSGANGTKSSPGFGATDYWVIRVDAEGRQVWEATFGGVGDDDLTALAVTPDGGFLAAGESYSPAGGNKTSDTFGSADYWVVRLDADGHKLWDRSYGGNSIDIGRSIAVRPNGDFIFGGTSPSVSGSGNKSAARFGNLDFWLVRANAAGDRIWDRSFGGTNWDVAWGMTPTPNGVALAGGSHGTGGNKSSPTFGDTDYWVVQTDEEGSMQWNRAFGGRAWEEAHVAVATRDGGLLVAGVASVSPGGNRTAPVIGGQDIWLVRTDASGNKLWDATVGTPLDDYVYGATSTSDGGFVLAGFQNVGEPGHALVPQALVIKLAPEVPRLTAPPQARPDLERDGFRLRLLGESNRVYVLESSPDLLHWTPWSTNLSPDIEMNLVDPEARTRPGPTFYRTR